MAASDPEQFADPAADSADGVFEGGGVKGIAFAGAIAAAEDELGVRDWVNVAGASAGAIVATLLAAGCGAADLRRILAEAPYRRFADYGWGGKWIGAPLNALRRRGIARGLVFKEWLADCLEASPLGDRDPTFAALVRTDLPADASEEQRRQARYRLRVIASDISSGQMLVLPDDIEGYEDEQGRRYTADDLPIVEAVRMSMSFPFFFDPVTLYRDRRPHLIVDGGLLSNFPVWLFDSPARVRRRTWGFRLHRGLGPETPPYREVPRPLWPLPMAKAMFFAATEAWDRRMMRTSQVRSVSIPTGDVPTLDFGLDEDKRRFLYESGYESARELFRRETEYMNSFGRQAPGPAAR